jgi:hypothetical protein
MQSLFIQEDGDQNVTIVGCREKSSMRLVANHLVLAFGG